MSKALQAGRGGALPAACGCALTRLSGLCKDSNGLCTDNTLEMKAFEVRNTGSQHRFAVGPGQGKEPSTWLLSRAELNREELAAHHPQSYRHVGQREAWAG